MSLSTAARRAASPRKALSLLLLLAALLPASASRAATGETRTAVRAVPSLDLARYAGRWFEIARLPNRFQKSCACCVTASYAPRADGRLGVVNECTAADGRATRAEGVARLAAPGGPASQLKVRFAPAFLSFLSAVWGDYWVLELAPDYSYALVGSPDTAYLWILARAPSLPEETYAALLATARSQGFDVSRVVRTPQGSQTRPITTAPSDCGRCVLPRTGGHRLVQ